MAPRSIAELQSIRRVLGLAFCDDPLMQWIFREGDHRLELTAAWLGLMAEGYMQGGRVDTITDADGQVIATALWKIPADSTLVMPELPAPLNMLAAIVGDSRASELIGSFGTFVDLWPEQAHAYLGLLGVDPEHQQKGYGRLVIQPGIEASAAAGLGVVLETNNEQNLAFYRSLGFEVIHEYVMGPDGPPGWSLWLDCPQPTGR